MGYRSANSIVNVESGIEGIPAKRAYAWADLLELPRDAFFQFITGQIPKLDTSSSGTAVGTLASLASDERELLASYRRLRPASRVLVRELATKLAEAPRRRRR